MLGDPIFWIGCFSGFGLLYVALQISRLTTALLWKRDLKFVKNMKTGGFEPKDIDEPGVRIIRKHRNKLLYSSNIDPEWVGPLFERIKLMVPEIANHYYPDSSNPIFAPKLSEILYSAQMMTKDIHDMLTTRRLGRLLNISTEKYKKMHQIMQKETFKKAGSMIGKAKWVYRIARYKNPVTYIALFAKNTAVRTFQYKVFDQLHENLRRQYKQTHLT